MYCGLELTQWPALWHMGRLDNVPACHSLLGKQTSGPLDTVGSVLSSVSLEPECHWRGDQTTEGEGEHGEGHSHRGQEDFARQRSGRGSGQGSPLPHQPGASIPSWGRVFYWVGVAILSPFPSPSQHEKRASYGDPFVCKESRKGVLAFVSRPVRGFISGLCIVESDRWVVRGPRLPGRLTQRHAAGKTRRGTVVASLWWVPGMSPCLQTNPSLHMNGSLVSRDRELIL